MTVESPPVATPFTCVACRAPAPYQVYRDRALVSLCHGCIAASGEPARWFAVLFVRRVMRRWVARRIRRICARHGVICTIAEQGGRGGTLLRVGLTGQPARIDAARAALGSLLTVQSV